MKKYHLTITDNESGKTIVDEDTKCIIGAADNDGDATHSFCFSSCNGVELLATAFVAIKTAKMKVKKICDPEQLLDALTTLEDEQ